MTGPKDERPDGGGETRPPAFAGLFYPDDPQRCVELARAFVLRSARERGSASEIAESQVAPSALGGMVPHAGWVCSGAVAGETIGTLARAREAAALPAPQIVVVFAAIHTPLPIEDGAALDSYSRWSVPGHVSDVAPELRAKLLAASTSEALFRADDRFHRREHAVEVELPLIAAAWPDATILPVEVPLAESAVDVGRETAKRIAAMGLERQTVFLASSDLTHYGPAYRFAPAGVGLKGLAWARDNDRQLLDRIERFEVEDIVSAVRDGYSACGGGAIAATLAACRELGARGARVLRHTNSYEVLSALGHREDADNAVGYAAVLVG
jgi:AmmeMemoRadiSam system protein B